VVDEKEVPPSIFFVKWKCPEECVLVEPFTINEFEDGCLYTTFTNSLYASLPLPLLC